ncbi:MAG: hypothetical protein ACM3PC_10150 [Deltaproteobacteria bacterium]
MRDLDAALGKIRTAAASRDTTALKATMVELEVIALQADVLPDTLVDGLSALLVDEAFLRLQDSWMVVKFFYDNWMQVTNAQRERLRSVIVRSFDKHADWMGAFVSAEILGERFADERALADLTELARTATLEERAAVPHGFELLATTAADKGLHALALERLQILASSSIQPLRDEAIHAQRNTRRRRP